MSPTREGYSHRFDAEEKLARTARAGLWAGAFIAPWDWRRRNCKTQVHGALGVPIDAQSKLCGSPAIPPNPNFTIKATLSSKQCILKGQYFYGALKMSARNKRWFCSKLDGGKPRVAVLQSANITLRPVFIDFKMADCATCALMVFVS